MLLRWRLLCSAGLLLACGRANTGAPSRAATGTADPIAGSGAVSVNDAGSMPAAPPDSAAPPADAGTHERDAGWLSDAGSQHDAGPYVAFGLNDVTILAPQPASSGALMLATDLMTDGTPLVPRALFERLNEEPSGGAGGVGSTIVTREAYEQLQLVAVRFELCDRVQPGPCSPSADGRLRLVLQPYSDSRGGFDDAGLHAFFSIPSAQIADVVRDLRALARLQNAALSLPLDVSPALAAGNTAYADALRVLVRRIAGERSFVRLALNAQPVMAAQIRWVMRGIELRDGVLADVIIPGIAGATEHVLTSGRGFEARPLSDTPKGMAEVINDRSFAAASAERKRELLAVLAAAENPNVSAPDTVSCIACHVATQLTHLRTTELGADPSAIEGRYTSSYDLTVQGTLRAARTIRALGWLRRDPVISQRVVNDTAQVLLELEARFPP
jgi:hypothetical protein